MKYKKMLEEARSKGVADEGAMWSSIEDVDELLADIKEEYPKMYWCFMRKSYANLFGDHYNEMFAMNDVANIRYTNKDGDECSGAHWTMDDINTATRTKIFPAETTDWDKYVAYNATYADFCKKFSDQEILEIAYQFFFADEDAPDGKVWRYMCAMM